MRRSANHGDGWRVLGVPAALAWLLAAACSTPAPDAADRRQTGPASAGPVATTGDALPRAALPMRCFENRLPDGSVLSLHYAERDRSVLGLLDYAFAEKDSARGTFIGTRDGDVITAVWTHQIEGTTGRQEITLRVADDEVVKANGELVEGADGVLRLKDAPAAVFNESFRRVACEH